MSRSTPAPLKRPARPRDAASLLIYRNRRGALEVLMGRRGSRARFLPDVYVFPGGAMAPQDARQARRTALREVYEETGLQLTQHLRSGGADGSAVLQILGRAITPTAIPCALLLRPRRSFRRRAGWGWRVAGFALGAGGQPGQVAIGRRHRVHAGGVGAGAVGAVFGCPADDICKGKGSHPPLIDRPPSVGRTASESGG